ncbi:MAG: aminopeptidase P family protein [Bacillaceae bacterium]|nr:aminopeptidase P family protein [Bacillaceae bacterium]
METRLNDLLKQLKKNGLDSIFITSKANIYYFTNFFTDPHERLVALFADQTDNPVLIVPELEKEDALQSGWKGDLLTYDDQTDPWIKLEKMLRDSSRIPNSMGIEKNQLTVDRKEMIEQIIPGCKLEDAQNFLNHLRMLKDKKEFNLLKQAAVLADLGVKTGIKGIQEGKTELELLAEIEYTLKREGVREMSFSTLVLSGPKTASPHGTPGKRSIQPGDFVLFDLGVVYEGYCSDITRTVAYQRVTEEQKDVYHTVLRAQEEAIQSVSIDTPVGAIDQRARKVIEDAGYGKYFTHRIGHGLGIDVHEFPSMHSNNTLPVQEGMCFTIEPGIYLPGVGGVRIEDEVFVTKNGAEILTSYPKELQIIG